MWSGPITDIQEKPLFIVFTLVSSHVPFDVVPPYIERWSSLGDGSLFNDLPKQEFNNNWLSGGEYPEGYTALIEYVLQSIADFLIQAVHDGTMVIVVGDHQPRFPISEKEATFSVPIHIISRNSDLVRSFKEFGFSFGIKPEEDNAHGAMEDFPSQLLSAILGTVPVPDPDPVSDSVSDSVSNSVSQ